MAWHDTSSARCPPLAVALCSAMELRGQDRQASPSSCSFTTALCLPTAGAVHPDELEIRPGAVPTAHNPEPDNHHAGTEGQAHESYHGSDPQADCCGGTGNRRATREPGWSSRLPVSATLLGRFDLPWAQSPLASSPTFTYSVSHSAGLSPLCKLSTKAVLGTRHWRH